MPSPIFKLEEQLVDIRSDQIAFKLTIENPSTEPLRLKSVLPRVPTGASLLEVIDTSLAEASTRKAQLLVELNRLLRQYLVVSSADFRSMWIERDREILREVVSITGYLATALRILITPKDWNARMKTEFNSFGYQMYSAEDARGAFVRWLESAQGHEGVKTLFEAKVHQLEMIEAAMNEGDRSGLTTIEPNSYFTATYVLKFRRRALVPRKYQLSFDTTYSVVGPERVSAPKIHPVATNILISPYPFLLSLFAVVAAVLGAMLKLSLVEPKNILTGLSAQASSGQLFVGPVVALIFYNAYEYTSLGKNLTMALSWRSALLIGSLCGIAQDRILAALKALIGA